MLNKALHQLHNSCIQDFSIKLLHQNQNLLNVQKKGLCVAQEVFFLFLQDPCRRRDYPLLHLLSKLQVMSLADILPSIFEALIIRIN